MHFRGTAIASATLACLLTGSSPGHDRENLTKLVRASLDRYADLEVGYEGVTAGAGHGNDGAFQGTYSRDGADRCRITCWHESQRDSEAGEVKFTYGSAGDGEFWVLDHGATHGQGSLNIDRARGPVAIQNHDSFERAFLLPALLKELSRPRAAVEISERNGGSVVAVAIRTARFVQRYEIDLGRNCSVLRRSKFDGEDLVDEAVGIELKEFKVREKSIWLPVACTFNNYFLKVENGRGVFAKSALASQQFRMTAGAFRAPAGNRKEFFKPPENPTIAVFDEVRTGKESRSRLARHENKTANEREQSIAAAMDRLEKEGRLGKAVARPGRDWWQYLPWLAGGLLLGAAGFLTWRSKA